MKTKVILLLLVSFLLCPLSAICKDDKVPQYDIEAAGSGQQGTYLVKISVYSKSKSVTDDILKKAAVHGVIFRGVPGGNGAPTQRPLAKSPSVEQEKAEYFKEFFSEGGIYTQYANIVSGSYDRIKSSKGYKLGAILQVNKDELRKELERSGIIKGLNSGF